MFWERERGDGVVRRKRRERMNFSAKFFFFRCLLKTMKIIQSQKKCMINNNQLTICITFLEEKKVICWLYLKKYIEVYVEKNRQLQL